MKLWVRRTKNCFFCNVDVCKNYLGLVKIAISKEKQSLTSVHLLRTPSFVVEDVAIHIVALQK